jgi:hypothetical protein
MAVSIHQDCLYVSPLHGINVVHTNKASIIVILVHLQGTEVAVSATNKQEAS